MWFQQISIPTPRRIAGTPKGEGGGPSKAKILKGRYEPKLEFPKELKVWGLNQKPLCGKDTDIFSGTIHFHFGRNSHTFLPDSVQIVILITSSSSCTVDC